MEQEVNGIESVEGCRQSSVNFGLEFGKDVSPNSKQKGCPRKEDGKVRFNNHPIGATNYWLRMKGLHVPIRARSPKRQRVGTKGYEKGPERTFGIKSVEGYRQSHVNFGLEFGKVVSPNSKQNGCPRNEDVKVRYKNHPTGATNDQRSWLCMKDFKYQSVQLVNSYRRSNIISMVRLSRSQVAALRSAN